MKIDVPLYFLMGSVNPMQSNEQSAIDAGEEQTPRLANKDFYTCTMLYIREAEQDLCTILRFDKDANSELFESNMEHDAGTLIMRSEDPDGPPLASLIDGLTTYISSLAPGKVIFTEEQIRIVCEDISSNY